MDRPQIKNFIPNASLSEAHEIYRKSPVLWGYIQALDAYIDSIESKVENQPISDVSNSVCSHPDKKRILTGEILYCEECMKVLKTDC